MRKTFNQHFELKNSALNGTTMERDRKINWSQDRVIELIGYWKNCECLYNPSHRLYNNRNARQEALERITQQMSISMPQLTMNDVKTKMNYLRSQYCREMHKYPLGVNKNCTISEDNYKNCPYWFDSLSFVKKYVGVYNCGRKRENIEHKYFQLNSSNENTISIDDMPLPIKRSRSNDFSPTSTNQSEEAAMYLYKPDPDILEMFQRQLATVSSTQPSTSSKSSIITEPTAADELPHTSSSTTASVHAADSEYDQTFMSFIKLNLGLIADVALKDELMDKIAMLLLEYKGKQRKLDQSFRE